MGVLAGLLAGLSAGLSGCSQAFLDDDAGPGPADPGPVPDAFVLTDAVTLPPVSVDFADPAHGPFRGGTEVTLRGRGFAGGMTVTFGGRSVAQADLQVLDDHRAIVVTPAGTPGPADVAITVGSDAGMHAGAFTYDPVVVEPPGGSVAGGTFIRVTGLGVAFAAGTQATLDGEPVTGLTIVNAQELTGYTPPGTPGAATLRIVAPEGVEGDGLAPIEVADAFTFEATTASQSGGFGGGLLEGTLNFTVIDDYTGDGIPMAYVVVGDPATSTASGVTDPFGEITLTGPELSGQITLTVGHPKYETGVFAGFDARDATMFLVPLPPDPNDPPPPDTGPFPPGPAPASVGGDLVTGGATAIGTDTGWPLVPEPADGEIKRAYVFATGSDIFSSGAAPQPGGTVDYQPGQTAWHYEIVVRPSPQALVALAGLYNTRTQVFVPYAMGVRRAVIPGPGTVMDDVAIPLDIPLDTAILVRLRDTPPLGAGGPDEYQVTALIDLGGEGVIRLPSAHAEFADGPQVILPSMATIGGPIADASYSFVVGAYTQSTLIPYSARIVRGVRDVSRPVDIDDFVGVPRAVDPPAGGSGSSHRLVMSSDGGKATPAFFYHRLTATDGTPVYRILARGDRLEVPLYDLTGAGLPPLTTQPLIWSVTTVSVPGVTFDSFTYAQLNANLWHAYAAATFNVAFP